MIYQLYKKDPESHYSSLCTYLISLIWRNISVDKKNKEKNISQIMLLYIW